MIILNLANKNNTDIQYKIIKFPDGQQSVELLSEIYDNDVEIITRINSFLDLEVLICVTQILKHRHVKNICLTVPYFIGGRSDRQFSLLGVNYIKNVIAPIINSQDYYEVNVLDPHSDVLEACINNFRKLDVYSNFISHVKHEYESLTNKKIKDAIIVSPDAGSLKKVYDIAKKLESDEEVIVANKHRDVQTGKILSTNVSIPLNKVDKDIFIIDDICDGGRTFIELSKAIKLNRSLSFSTHPSNYGNIYLIVTHGIFSNGLDELDLHFDRIYTTNSVKQTISPLVISIDIL